MKWITRFLLLLFIIISALFFIRLATNAPSILSLVGVQEASVSDSLATRGLVLRLSPAKIQFTTDEYPSFDATLTNVSTSSVRVFWRSCAESAQYFLDGTKILDTTSGAKCAIGPSHIKPGETLDKHIQISPAAMEYGQHTFKVVIDRVYSNETTFSLVKGDGVSDCYNFTDAVTPHCRHLLIHTNIGAGEDENNDRCARIKRELIDGTKLRPIPSLSTVNCSEGKSAYFVMNVPAKELEYWRDVVRKAGDWTQPNVLDVFTEDTIYNRDLPGKPKVISLMLYSALESLHLFFINTLARSGLLDLM